VVPVAAAIHRCYGYIQPLLVATTEEITTGDYRLEFTKADVSTTP